jgi:hypothetical protein
MEHDHDHVVVDEVLAQLEQPAIADPAELPAKIPSSRAMRRVITARPCR